VWVASWQKLGCDCPGRTCPSDQGFCLERRQGFSLNRQIRIRLCPAYAFLMARWCSDTSSIGASQNRSYAVALRFRGAWFAWLSICFKIDKTALSGCSALAFPRVLGVNFNSAAHCLMRRSACAATVT
jgi:hypothetical protein